MARGDLTSKETDFIDAYVANGFNGTQAALQVYEVGGKNKENSASSLASEMLAKDKIKLAIVNKIGALQDSVAQGLQETAILLRKWIVSKDVKRQEFAAKQLIAMSSLLQADKPTSNTHNHLHLPKRG